MKAYSRSRGTSVNPIAGPTSKTRRGEEFAKSSGPCFFVLP